MQSFSTSDGWLLFGGIDPASLKSMGSTIFSRMKRLFLLFVITLPVYAIAQNPLKKVIASDTLLNQLADAQEKYQIQIVYTQINRDESQTPTFTTFEWGTDKSLYYYPASTVKMPAAFVVMEKIHQLSTIGLDRNTRLEIGTGSEPQTPYSYDSTSTDGIVSVAQFVKEIFVVSDNDAYNRLYEIAGQRYLNESLHRKGYADTRIIHRLGPGGFPFDAKTNRYTNPVTFYNDDGAMIYHQGEVLSEAASGFELKKEIRGVAQQRDGEIIDEPFDFTTKNFFALRDMHDVLKAVIFPEATPPSERFDLSSSDYKFLYEWMSKLPDDSGIEKYAGKADSYAKFFMFGDREGEPIPDHIRIFNKVGWAYGFLTDVSYVIDTDAGVEYFIAATIHVNENETYNDGVYEYETVGLPFFGHLGRAIHNLEKERKRKVKPDFSKF